MSAIIKEVYDAFRSAGVSDEQAAAAALAIPPSGDLATKSDISGLRSALKGEISEIRTELKGDISGLRSELKNDISGLRSELKNEISALRSEIKSQISELRSEVKSDITVLHSEIGKLRADTRGDLKELELRMTLKFFAALGMAVAGVKALDFLIG